MFKKFTSLMVAMFMVMSLVPMSTITAFASSGEASSGEPSSGYVMSGKVTDEDTGEGISGAEITITHTDTSDVFNSTTNEDGDYILEGMVAGIYELLIQHPDYTDYTGTTNTDLMGSDPIDFKLVKKAPVTGRLFGSVSFSDHANAIGSVRLIAADSTVVATSEMNEYGYYDMTGITVGTYTLEVYNGEVVYKSIPDVNILAEDKLLNILLDVPSPFIAVSNIMFGDTVVEEDSELTLIGTVTPANATNKIIEWSIVDAGTTGAVLNGDKLTASNPGMVNMKATITNGTAVGFDYIQDVVISVIPKPLISYEITLDTNGIYIGDQTTLTTALNGKLHGLPYPSVEGYNFKGWFTAENGCGEQVTIDTVFTENTTIYAHWEVITAAEYTVSFDSTGGSTCMDIVTVNSKLETLPTPIRFGYSFIGWFTSSISGEKITTDTIFASNETVYAHWVPAAVEFEIQFYSQGGSACLSQVTVGGKLQTLPTPTKDGKVFLGWFTDAVDGVKVTTDTIFSANSMLFAHWEDASPVEYVVTFNANGGNTDVASAVTVHGKLVGMPTPTKENHTFKGWFTGEVAGEKVTIDTLFDADTTVFARWEIVNNNPGGNTGGNTGGSSDNDDSDRATDIKHGSSANVDSTGEVSIARVVADVKESITNAANNTITAIRTINAGLIKKEAIKAILDTVAQTGKQIVVHADTMNAGAVQGRIYLEPAKLVNGAEEIKLGVYTDEDRIAPTKSLFEKYFDNNVAVIKLDHQKSFGTRLQIAALADISKLDSKNLYFYAYDNSTNTYNRIYNTGYWVDSNGYVRLYTSLAGDIVITDKVLTSK